MTDRISVLIPTFNREKYIKIAIESIQKQTYTDLAIIVYDDGSTDNTVNIVLKLLDKDPRIQLIAGPENKGIGHARNQLLDACNTKYAVWQDSDDVSRPDRIQLLKRAMRKEQLIFSNWTWLHYFRGEWQTRIRNTHNKAFATLMFPVNTSIRFNEQLKIGGEDWIWIKNMQKIYNEILIPDRLYHVRFHTDRIGSWKLKFRKHIPKDLLGTLSYAEMIKYYKEHYA